MSVQLGAILTFRLNLNW